MAAFWSVFVIIMWWIIFENVVCFIITLAHGHPQLDGGGVEGEVGARPSPSWEHIFTLLWGHFSPYKGPLFSFWGALFLSLHCFGGYFLHVRDYFSLFVESFSGMSSLTKIAASAHAFAARVVASVAHSGNLRDIARLNLLIHFRAHFHVMLGKPMK